MHGKSNPRVMAAILGLAEHRQCGNQTEIHHRNFDGLLPILFHLSFWLPAAGYRLLATGYFFYSLGNATVIFRYFIPPA